MQYLCDFFSWLSLLTFDKVILTVLGVSSVVSVLAWTGFLPSRISKKISLNRAEETMVVLSKLGINPDKYSKGNVSKSIPDFIDANNLEKTLHDILKTCTIESPVGVGKTEQVRVESYIDVMSLSTDSKSAQQLARCLTSYWKQKLIENDGLIKNSVFDIVVTPKGGSPILGYEFSKIMETSFALHISGNHKFTSSDAALQFKSCFDSVAQPEEGSIALVVDDSATGGRKVLETIADLKAHGIVVTDCLVLFEPVVKGIRERLKTQGIQLHAIVEKKI